MRDVECIKEIPPSPVEYKIFLNVYFGKRRIRRCEECNFSVGCGDEWKSSVGCVDGRCVRTNRPARFAMGN